MSQVNDVPLLLGHRKEEGYEVFVEVCNYWFQFVPFSRLQAPWNEELMFYLLPTELIPITLGYQYTFIGKFIQLKTTVSLLCPKSNKSHAKKKKKKVIHPLKRYNGWYSFVSSLNSSFISILERRIFIDF